ncbi:MAG: MFS transporter [Comamonas sp.]
MQNNNAQQLSIARVLLCGGAVVTLSMGIRHGFGLWLQPITQEMGWTRESFALALAVQNLSWGLIGIFTGMLADRFGATKVLIAGAILYALGLVGMAWAPTTLMFTLTAGLLIGIAQTGTTYAVIYGVIGRQIPAEKRSWSMGVAAAAGSFGQFFMVPVEGQLIAGLGWHNALVVCAVLVLIIIPMALALREPNFHALKKASAGAHQQSIAQAVAEAFKSPSFLLLTAGYFVCGFQVMFIGVHMPSYLKDFGLPPHVASYSLALIGLFNIFGTYLAGSLGQRVPKRYLLSGIYFIRAVAIVLFLLAPLSPWSVYLFAAVMGFLWLSTVPLTNGLLAQIFGIQHLSMLSGFAFFSHQIGSFLGIWLGGYLYDTTGSYDAVWYVAIGLGVIAGLINLPVKETPVQRKFVVV